MENTVSIVKCEEYDFNQVYSAVKELLELAPPPDVSGKIVLLKPNILYPKKPELAVCTHPVVVGAAVKCFVELGAKKVLVGESPAIAGSVSAAKATGMYDLVLENGGEWADFSGKVVIENPEAKICKSFEVAEQVPEADIIISISKLKSHQFMSYTGAMKNLFGVMIKLDKSGMHYVYPKKEDFAAFIVDLNQALRPQYAIMDAIVGMEGPGGPGSGDPIKLGFLAASQNILAVDAVCSSAVGYDPMEITYIKDGLERGLWLKSLDDIKIEGELFENIKHPEFKAVHDKQSSETLGQMIAPWIDKLANWYFVKNPHFINDKCIRCGQCIKICPPKILKFVDDNSKMKKHVEINRKNCIHCFCCHEICPAEAIKLKRL